MGFVLGPDQDNVRLDSRMRTVPMPKTDEEAKKIIPQGEQWAVVYDHCRDQGISITESILATCNAKERLAAL